ncbi:androgen-induced gene 1 protein isoform 5-T5 [Spinachia spinachia]
MALIPSQVLRVAILLSYFSILCHYKALDMPARHTYGGSWKFLTFIDLHTTVLPFLIIEMRTTNHRYPSRSWGLAAVCFFGVGYVLWTCWVHQVTGVWVYPVLERFTPLARGVFFSAMMAVICVFYTLGDILNSYIWDQPHTAKVKGE